MDGHSIAPFLIDASAENVPASTRRHLADLGAASTYADGWREAVFIEYYYVEFNTKCMEKCNVPGGNYPHHDSWCTDLHNNSECFVREEE